MRPPLDCPQFTFLHGPPGFVMPTAKKEPSFVLPIAKKAAKAVMSNPNDSDDSHMAVLDDERQSDGADSSMAVLQDASQSDGGDAHVAVPGACNEDLDDEWIQECLVSRETVFV